MPVSGDFSGDGSAAILWRHSTGIVAAWLVNGTGIAGIGVVGNVTSDWHLAGVGDLNGDGRADILWRNSAGFLAEWLLNGTNIVGPGSPRAATTDWQVQQPATPPPPRRRP